MFRQVGTVIQFFLADFIENGLARVSTALSPGESQMVAHDEKSRTRYEPCDAPVPFSVVA